MSWDDQQYKPKLLLWVRSNNTSERSWASGFTVRQDLVNCLCVKWRDRKDPDLSDFLLERSLWGRI